jgi:hypothetical protein
VALFVSSFVLGPSFNLDGTMTGKLPTVVGDFGVAAFREVEFEEAMFLVEAEFETSAAMPDDWPNMSAVAVAVKSRAAPADNMRVRRNLHILFLPPNDWAFGDCIVVLRRLAGAFLRRNQGVWERIQI